MRKSALVALVLSLLAPIPVVGQERDRLDDRGELLGWEGVGRLDLANSSCTGTLISRDLVLTAAHCVVDAATGQVYATQSMRFHAGFTHGHTAATRRVKKVVVANGYVSASSASVTQQVQNDLALLRLDGEIFSSQAEPFKVHSESPNNTRVTLVSYGRGRSQSLQRESGCRLKETYLGGLMTFDCDVTFGSSGAPVFTSVDGRLRIISVISMMSQSRNGGKEAIGMTLPTVVSAMMREMRNDASRAPVSAGAKRLDAGQRSTGGARFVKPGG